MKNHSLLGWLIALWGSLGVIYILANGIAKVLPIALEAFETPFSLFQWIVLVLWSGFMAYSEGYRGFQNAFSPRVAARARWLRENPGLIRGVFAPFFCMGYFEATRKRKIVAWCLSTGIILLIILIKLMPQPWRGIIDMGVVIGLGWGLASLVYFLFQSLLKAEYTVDPELSEKALALQANSAKT